MEGGGPPTGIGFRARRGWRSHRGRFLVGDWRKQRKKKKKKKKREQRRNEKRRRNGFGGWERRKRDEKSRNWFLVLRPGDQTITK